VKPQEDLAAELSAALHGLDEVARIVKDGRGAFEANEDRQRALALCWMSIGSSLKHYARLSGIPQGQLPLAQPIRLRDKIAHQRLDKIDCEILWQTSVGDAPSLLRMATRLLDQLG